MSSDSDLPLSGVLAGHAWTVWPLVRDRLRRDEPPLSLPWSTPIPPDAPHALPGLRLRGRLTVVDPERLVVMVHGLGGWSESRYLRRAARVAAGLGLSSLRLDLRGAGRTPEGAPGDLADADIYHAGLSSDLAVVVADEALADFREIYVLGFSLGGHLVLRYATETRDERVRAVAALCSPIDLESTVDAFDVPARLPYRRYVLSGLKETYRALARLRDVPTPVERVERVTRIREWDELVVVPRFGFGTTDRYYSGESVAPRLGDLRVPALLVASERDPMVDATSIRRALPAAGDRLTVRLLHAGGHVAFPDRVDLALPTAPSLESGVESGVQAGVESGVQRGVVGQILRWLEEA